MQISGGTSNKKMTIPLFKMNGTKEDCDAVNKVILRGSSWAEGPEIEQFEKAVAKYSGVKYGVALNSGTSALHVLLEAYKLKYPGSFEDFQVIVPSFTFISTATSVLLAGGVPVFADIEPDTCALNADDVENKITVKTKAIILVHYGGTPARDTIKLKHIADRHNILLIEDNAESMGATIDGKMTGTFGDAGMLSFCQNKITSCGEGGMILTNSENMSDTAKYIRSHGRKDGKFIYPGYNYRMPSMCAALGLSQLNRIDSFIKERRVIAKYLKDGLKSIVDFPKELDKNKSVYQLFTIIHKTIEERNKVEKALTAHNIGCKIYFPEVDREEIYSGDFADSLPITKFMAERVLTIPLYIGMTTDEMDTVINVIKEAL